MTRLLKNATVLGSVVIALGIAAACTIWYFYFGPGYYSELYAIKRELLLIPTVSVAEIDGDHDVTLNYICATIAVESKGQMDFYDLRRNSFTSTDHLRLRGIGKFSVRVEGEGNFGDLDATKKSVRSEFHADSVDIGPGGAFASLFPFSVNNVQAAVRHYDEILRIIESWPRRRGDAHLNDANGTDYYYYVVPSRSGTED